MSVVLERPKTPNRQSEKQCSLKITPPKLNPQFDADNLT